MKLSWRRAGTVAAAVVATAAAGAAFTVAQAGASTAHHSVGASVELDKLGKPVSQRGVISSPISRPIKGAPGEKGASIEKSATAEKGDGESAVFKVTGDRTQAWLATGKTVVIENGKQVGLSALAKGEHVTLTGVTLKVVVKPGEHATKDGKPGGLGLDLATKIVIG